METLPNDLIVHLAMELDLNDLISLCQTSKKINRSIYNNKYLWLRKLFKDFGVQSQDVPKKYNYKEYYQHIVTQIKYEPDNLDKVLMDAVTNGDLNLVKISLNPPSKFTNAARADTDNPGYPIEDVYWSPALGNGHPLRVAALNGYLDIVKYLIENGTNPLNTIALLWSIIHGHINIVKYLIPYNQRYIRSAFESSILHGHVNIFTYLYQNWWNKDEFVDEWLIIASGNGIKDKLLHMVEHLLTLGPTKENIYRAIESSRKYGNIKTAEYLESNISD